MTVELFAVTFAALDPPRLATFWAGLLGREQVALGRDAAVLPDDEHGFRLRFAPTDVAKSVQNLMHLDLTSESWDAQRATVDRALSLGGRHCDVGQLPTEEHVVLADPEGNELCVIEPGNSFLAGCGFVGALSCDGSPAVGRFWSAALGWPLVWDQDEETAIQSPLGGPKVTWGGPPYMARPAEPHQWFDLLVEGDVLEEQERLVGLGATVLGPGRLADPDGGPFRLLHRVAG
jgi:hypothetical protein